MAFGGIVCQVCGPEMCALSVTLHTLPAGGIHILAIVAKSSINMKPNNFISTSMDHEMDCFEN